MPTPELKLSELFDQFKPLLTEMVGEDRSVQRISPADRSNPGDLVFADKKEYMEVLLRNRPSAAVVSSDFKEREEELKGITLLYCSNVNLAHALIRQRYDDRDMSRTGWSGVHPSSVVHPDATLPGDCMVGPGVVIGPGVRMGEGCVIMANSVIEEGVVMGRNVVIHPSVVVGYDTQIGDNVIIKSGSVIGSEGYGFAQDEKRKSYRIPQRGRVVLEDDVVVGANNCIDRATYDETRIGRGTKLDNLCHIAHNVKVGEDCLLTAGLIVAGSTSIGNRVITSGQTGILDHLTIADDTIFVHRAGVTDNVTERGIYAGLPIQPLNEYMKNNAVLRKLSDLRKKVQVLEKQIREGR